MSEFVDKKGWSGKRKAGTNVWFSQEPSEIPNYEIAELSPDVFASYSGPDRGLAIVPDLEPVPPPTIKEEKVDKEKNVDTQETSQGGKDAVQANAEATGKCQTIQEVTETEEMAKSRDAEQLRDSLKANVSEEAAAAGGQNSEGATKSDNVEKAEVCDISEERAEGGRSSKPTDHDDNVETARDADGSDKTTNEKSTDGVNTEEASSGEGRGKDSVELVEEGGKAKVERSEVLMNGDIEDEITQRVLNMPQKYELPAGEENAGSEQWNVKNRKAYGICMSLYEQHPISGKISGEPIADSFGLCTRKNNAVMVVADGVNWGEKSKLAARCAVYGSMRHINHQIFGGKPVNSTHDAFMLLLRAVDKAHDTIIYYGGGQTTLCMALVLPLLNSKQYAICVVNVGDSLAYVFSKYHGIREITTGSHDIQTERDIRDAGGAVGPVHGLDPELHNLTCSMTVADPGDIIYLTTDGISDNFDPVVTKIAVAKRRFSNPELQISLDDNTVQSPTDMDRINERERNMQQCGTLDGKPEMVPHERHQYAVKEMERIVHEFELFTEQQCSAQELCGALLQHVLKLSDAKRKVLENPDLYGKKLRSKDRKRRDSEIIAKLSKSPGKLDHATIIGYEVGCYRGDDMEDYEAEEISEEEEDEETEKSPGTSSPQDPSDSENEKENYRSGPWILSVVPQDVIPYGIDLDDDIQFIDEMSDGTASTAGTLGSTQ